MAFEQGNAGESVRQLAKKRYFYRVLVLLIGIVISVSLLFFLPNTKGFTGPMIAVMAIIIIMSLIKEEK